MHLFIFTLNKMRIKNYIINNPKKQLIPPQNLQPFKENRNTL